MKKLLMNLIETGCLVLIAAGCGAVTQEKQPVFDERETVQMGIEIEIEDVAPKEVAPLKGSETNIIESNTGASLPNIPQPVNELTDNKYYWSQLLARDAIAPIYDPQFAPADEAPYDDNELVIGVEINGEAKAYAIGPLNTREMVNDTVGGVPVLVTW